MKISVIGAGNVATHLVTALNKISGTNILQVISRDKSHAKYLAMQVKADYTNELSRLKTNFDLLLICTSDDALTEIVGELDVPQSKIICHTAGSISSKVFDEKFKRYGVLYPLQTFSKNKSIDWRDVPIFLTTSDDHTEKRLLHLAKQLSKNVEVISDEQRFALHIAAVYACNFTNAVMQVSQELCEKNNLDFSLLKPLIDETVSKVWKMGPKDAQTGPARRADTTVINKHLKFLEDMKTERELYQLLTKYIGERY